MDPKFAKMKALLEDQHSWPCKYSFKFIVPVDKLSLVLASLGEEGISTKPSSKGKYISVTCSRSFNTADDVIKVYQSVSHIDGIISL